MAVEKLAPTAVVKASGQCFIGHEKDDLLWHGEKLAGAAQRRSRNGLLIQGSVQPSRLAVSRNQWQQAMREAASEKGTEWSKLDSAELLQRANVLAQKKYSQASHNQRR